MTALPSWPEDAFCDHRLYGPTDLFVDESGPRADGTCTLGVFIVSSELAAAASSHLGELAAQLCKDFPALAAATYGGEWKGRLLARSAATTRERRAIGRGELLSDKERQAVYARCLAAIRKMPAAGALAVTYCWTGPEQGAEGMSGYRIRRIVQFALSALAFHGVSVRRACIDNGHPSHYSAGIEEYARVSGSSAIPHVFVDSRDDRRVQLADLIAFAGHTSRFPGGSRAFTTAPGWLKGFVGERLITLGDDADHHVIEP
ncbi:MAG TPA: hypothetical protein VG147_06195 [Solirubrobacteraceae bacterium]|jgi:hypothetical protein|nr:hypothetical protein [Solirubrobacteraceae bacterium]